MCTSLLVTDSHSHGALEAIRLLADSIRSARIKRGMSMAELAARIGVSRQSVHRIERGEPGSGIGSVFEAAVMVGVTLFEAKPNWPVTDLPWSEEKLARPPMKIDSSKVAVETEL
jgi:DNA-binding XRE family transcriptional regulator